MSTFLKNYSTFQLLVKSEYSKGLRETQVGAVGAVLAHFALRNEPALVSMPTGTGKTAVMISLCYALRAAKVLVVTPSLLVRNQIVKQFKELTNLAGNGILPQDVERPNVYNLKGLIQENEKWREILKQHDVVVGIPSTLSQSKLSEVLDRNAFDLVIVDEAHHSRANTWDAILSYFSGAKQILMTATPFRNDKKALKARLVYNYPLKQAYDAGLFSKINYIPVESAQDQSKEAKDIAIAKKTEQIFQEHKDAGHKILIRTDTKTRAVELDKTYKEHTGLKLEVIHSQLSPSTITGRVKNLESDKLDGVICVDMMGEGYDFPSLKIAAIHSPHKSLAITLQFIGRIGRTNVNKGNMAHVVANTHDFAIDAEKLFRETADWSKVIPELHRRRVDRTEAEQDFFDNLTEITPTESSYLVDHEEPVQLRDSDLKPLFHTKIFSIGKNILHVNKRPDVNEDDGKKPIDIQAIPDFGKLVGTKNLVLRHHHVSIENSMAVFIFSELLTPPWYTVSDSLKDVVNSLVIVYFDEDTALLFICSTTIPS